jgi:Ca2+-binding RTX toxin-like protein
MRRFVSIVALLGLALLAMPATPAPAQTPGGPLVLMGIDAEDCGPGGHGPISVYESVVNDIMSKTTKAGAGILVIGGGKEAEDCVTSFWDTLSVDTGHAVTYVNGAANIAIQSFSAFKMLAVASDEDNTSNGLTQDEHNALSARKNDVAAFVNAGGGLLGFSSVFTPSATDAGPYDYLTVIGSFVLINESYSDITPTADGMAIGITDDLDVSAWHQTFDVYPSFLKVLATNAESGDASFGKPAALGGAQVFVGTPPPVTPAAPAPNRCPGYEDVAGKHLVGTPGDDVLVAPGPAFDVICGLGGDDFIRGRFQNDILDGGRGNDIVRGGNRHDLIFGRGGQDKLRGRRGADEINGGKGIDILIGGFGDDLLKGGEKLDDCDGGRGRNTLRAC